MLDEHKKLVKEIFDRAASEYGEKGCSFFDYFGERLVALANLIPGGKILDIATAKGAVLFPAAKLVGENGQVIGIDISPKMIDEARRRALYGWIELRQMDAEQLDFPDGSFDFVFCAFALFFIPSVFKGLNESKRILKPNGRLAISTFGKKAALDLWISEKVREY